jgi:Uma2 family endonuclease
MAGVLDSVECQTTMADILKRLGGIAPDRVRVIPAFGDATERDVINIEVRENRLFELIDGILVEKSMGFYESLLAGTLLTILNNFIVPRNLGLVTGADGMIRLFPGQVRIPDVAFVSWARIPGGRVPREPIPDLVPDLAIEVLSESNTAQEMIRKRREYFEAGVRLIWEIDPAMRTVAVFHAPDTKELLTESQVLDGGDVLAGFSLNLANLFGELDRQAGN